MSLAGALRARQREADAALAEEAAQAHADATLGLGRSRPPQDGLFGGDDGAAAYSPFGSRANVDDEFAAAAVVALLPELQVR